MFGPKQYHCVCHGCGKFHIVTSSFLSASSSVGFRDGDKEWVLPAHGCPECIAEAKTAPIVNGRHVGRISNAYANGMTPEARKQANAEFTEWLPRLEAAR